MTNPELLGDYLRDCARELQLNDEVDREVDILFELRAYMEESLDGKVWSSEFTDHLNQMGDAIWSTYNRGWEIKQSQVSRQVGKFVPTKTVKKGQESKKGWTYEQCRDAFSRYLPPEETTQATPPSSDNEKQLSEKRHQGTPVSDRCQKVSGNGEANGSYRYTDVSDVSDNGQGIGEEDLLFENPDFGKKKKSSAYDDGLET